MRYVLLTFFFFASIGVSLWCIYPGAGSASSGLATVTSEVANPVLELAWYDDPEYGFSVAVPSGWTRIIAADESAPEIDDVSALLELGYAVGFESPRSSLNDRFADYILIEVMPGDDSELFVASERQRKYFSSGQEKILYDRLLINADKDSASDVDLVIFQRGEKAFGYTLAFYAIGEPANEQAMFEAFQIMLRTYTQNADPFIII